MRFLSSRTALFLLFLVLGITGLWHGFPLIDIFADEMYFAYGPLGSLQQHTLFPVNVPYGTVTFYFVLPLQILMLVVAFAYGLWTGSSLEAVIMGYPFLAYIAPRVLSVALFLGMLLRAQAYYAQRPEGAPYAQRILLILFSNLVLLTFAHSGKMWMTSVFFLLLAGVNIARSSVRSMTYAGLSFANFPLMGVFWVQTFLANIVRERRRGGRAIRTLLATAILVPLAVMLLNAGGIWAQVVSIVQSHIAPGVATGAPAAVRLSVIAGAYASTFLAYLQKIVLTSLPALLLGIVALATRARIRDRALFVFASIGMALFLLAVSTMFISAHIPGFLRYLQPFHVLVILLFLSLEFPRTRLVSSGITGIAAFSLYLAIVNTVSLALPTTFNVAYRTVLTAYNDERFVILSNVAEITQPYNKASAELVRQFTPDACSHRCRFVLQHGSITDLRAAFLFVPSPEIAEKAAAATAASGRTVMEIIGVPDQWNAVSAEYGLGSYFLKEAWIPSRLGQPVIVRPRSVPDPS